MTTTNPLAEIRCKGFDADLHENRLRVWPRHKMSKADCQFITANLAEIIYELAVEENGRSIKNFFLWELPAQKRTEFGDSEGDTIPGYMNGEDYSHG